MNTTKLLLVTAAALLLAGCETETSSTLEDSIVETTPETAGTTSPRALFDPSTSVIPFPNNLLFSGSEDGTLNIPVADEDDLSDPQVALNALDGFSTVAPMSTGFSDAVDEDSVSGNSVKLYRFNQDMSAYEATLEYGTDFVAQVSSVDMSGQTLAIVPLRPLMEKKTYIAAITDSLTASSGSPFKPSVTYQLIKTLDEPLEFCEDPNAASCTLPGSLRSLSEDELADFEALRMAINGLEAAVDAADDTLFASNIIQGWSFTTQSIGDVLVQVQTDLAAGAAPASAVADSGADSPLGAADIYVGSLTVPYYLEAASSANDATPLASFWQGAGGSLLSQYNPTPVKTSDQVIPLMASIPKGAAPGGGWPVVIYQHGITTNRSTMLAVADAMAAAGLAVVAIDMPLHGLTGNETDGTEDFYQAGGVPERTFDLDLVDNQTGEPGADDTTDDSGAHFINLTNLLNTRDNLRQAVADLLALTYALPSTAGASFDTSKIYFLGHSLGAMVGTTFSAIEPTVLDVALAFAGGSLPKILDGSAAFSPQIVAGLSAAGVEKGTADYESFMGAAQSAVDTVDPINHAQSLASKGQGIVFFEIAGSNASPSDLVVPITVPDGNDSGNTIGAPLAGAEPLIRLMGLTHYNTDQGPGAEKLLAVVKFAVGNHASLLSDAADDFNTQETNAKVRTEIQTIASTFLMSGGVYLNINEAEADNLLVAP